MWLTPIIQFLVLSLLGLVSVLPLGLLRVLGRLVGWAHFALNTQTSKVTRINLEVCQPHLSDAERYRLTRASLLHTGQTLLEVPAVWLSPLARTRHWIIRVEGEHLLDDAIGTGSGVIVLLPHLGNWEVFNVYYARRGKMTALYHPPKQAFMRPIMARARERLGNELVATNAKGIGRLYKSLTQGRVTVILPDQVPASGKFAPFFGEPALTGVLVSRLIKKTAARAVCCVVYRVDGGFVVRFSEVDEKLYADDIDISLRGLNQSLEQCIGGHLEQYQWEYKRYRKRPAGLRKLYESQDGPVAYHK